MFLNLSQLQRGGWTQSPLYRVKLEREKQMPCINTYIWHLEKPRWWTYLQRRSRDADIENGVMDTAGEGNGRSNWESCLGIHTVSGVKQTVSGSGRITQGAQPAALWWTGGVGLRGGEVQGERIYIYKVMTDLYWCAAESTSTLQSNNPPI